MTISIGGAAKAAAKTAVDEAGLKKVAKQFEAVFMRQMISSMRSAKLGDELFGSSSADQFRDMSDARLADSMADKGFGIGDLLLRQFQARTQPGTGANPAAADGKASKAA